MANTYLTRTMGTPTDATKQTFSVWVKLASSGDYQGLVSSQYNSTAGGAGHFLGNSECIYSQWTYNGSANSETRVTAKGRDFFGWYHIVSTQDASQSGTDKSKIWINGVLQTDFVNDNRSNFSTHASWFANGKTLQIGRKFDNTFYFDGIMSHLHLCDGYAYQASDFGSFDSTTGEWKINTAPTVNYGNQGFFILKDNAGTVDLSGNGNNFTVSGGTITSVLDCPSNVFCTINPLSNKIDFNLANGNTTLNDNGTADNDNGIAGTMGVNSGKYYWEMKKGGSGGVMAVITDDVDIRLGNRATSSPDAQLWGFQSNGTGYNLVSYIAGTFSTSNALQGWGANDIVGYALDMDNGKLYVSINGVFKGLDNNTSDPVNGTNPAVTGIPTGGKFILPYFEKRSGDSPETICNFGNGFFGTTAVATQGTNASGNGIFEFDVPTGYTALSTKGLNL